MTHVATDAGQQNSLQYTDDDHRGRHLTSGVDHGQSAWHATAERPASHLWQLSITGIARNQQLTHDSQSQTIHSACTIQPDADSLFSYFFALSVARESIRCATKDVVCCVNKAETETDAETASSSS